MSFDYNHCPQILYLDHELHLDYHCIFRCGFVEVVTFSADEWVAHGDAITACHPIKDGRLTTFPMIQSNNLFTAVPDGWPADSNCRFRLADGRNHDEGDDWHYGRVRDLDPGTSRYEAAVLPLLRKRWPRVKTWRLPPQPFTPYGDAGTMTVDGETFEVADWRVEPHVESAAVMPEFAGKAMAAAPAVWDNDERPPWMPRPFGKHKGRAYTDDDRRAFEKRVAKRRQRKRR